jgi:serine/threonine protein kinase
METKVLGPIITNNKIGEGANGIVYNAQTKFENLPLAFKRNLVGKNIDFSGSIRELDILTKLFGHPFIIRLVSVSFGNSCHLSPIQNRYYKDDYIHFAFEKATYDGHVLIYEFNPAYSILKLGMVHLLLALEYMHAKRIIHRDIKPANTLYFENGSSGFFKLCDFGLSKIYTKQGKQTPKVVTTWYRAPEIELNYSKYNEKSDMWSIACTFFEMIARRPFLYGAPSTDRHMLKYIISKLPQNTNITILEKFNKNLDLSKLKCKGTSIFKQLGLDNVKIEEFNNPISGGLSSYGSFFDFVDLLEHLFVLDPGKRFSATEALNHIFFKGYRPLINKVRMMFPLTPLESEIPKIIYCEERKTACTTAFRIFNCRKELSWYNHRILFQSIDLFDRYLEYNNKCYNKLEVELKFMVCVYISIKYFSVMTIPPSFTEIINAKGKYLTINYTKSKFINIAKEFETTMIRDILKLSIYRETIYETSDKLDLKLSEEYIRDLLVFYGKHPENNKHTSFELLELFLKEKQNNSYKMTMIN